MRLFCWIFVFLVLLGFCSAFGLEDLSDGWGVGSGHGVNLIFLKYFMLGIFFALVYLVFSFSSLFDNKFGAVLSSLVISLLFVAGINPEDLLIGVSLNMGLLFTVVFILPFIVLGAFSLFAFERLDSFGVFLQRILWGCYGFYIFLASSGVLLFGDGFLEGLSDIFPFDYLWDYLFKYVFMFYEFVGFPDGSHGVAIFLFVFSLFVIWFLVIRNDFSSELIRGYIRDAKAMREEVRAREFKAVRDVAADAVENA